jgi:RNA polymerase sigma factor (sigma-70 family)
VTSTTLVSSPTTQSFGTRLWRAPDGTEVDVEALVLAYRSGDNLALQKLMACFNRMMTSAARRYLHCKQDVEDAVQDAWLAFVRAADGIDRPAALAGWLSTTTARAALLIARRQSRCVPSELSFERALPADERDPVVRGQEVAVVRDAVARLRPRDRELISMLFDEGLSYSQIEAQTGRPSGAIGPTRQRVITKLGSDRAIRHLALQGTPSRVAVRSAFAD